MKQTDKVIECLIQAGHDIREAHRLACDLEGESDTAIGGKIGKAHRYIGEAIQAVDKYVVEQAIARGKGYFIICLYGTGGGIPYIYSRTGGFSDTIHMATLFNTEEEAEEELKRFESKDELQIVNSNDKCILDLLKDKEERAASMKGAL